MRSVLPFIFVNFLWTGYALADDRGVEKYRNYTPEQIKALPEKEINNELPIIFKFAAQRGLSNGANLVFAMELNRLMYPGVSNYNSAVKAFQADLGDASTGILTVWQIHNLEQRADMQRLSRIHFPDQFSSYIDSDIASVNGTMTLLDEKIAWPINHLKLWCWKERNYCELNQIHIVLPSKSSWSQRYQVIENSTEYYRVSRWDKDSIDAVPQDAATKCRITSINLNFKTKEFFYITRNGGGDCKVLGTTIDKLPKPRIAQIADGAKIISAEFGAVEKAAFEVLASDFRRKVESLIAEDPKKK